MSVRMMSSRHLKANILGKGIGKLIRGHYSTSPQMYKTFPQIYIPDQHRPPILPCNNLGLIRGRQIPLRIPPFKLINGRVDNTQSLESILHYKYTISAPLYQLDIEVHLWWCINTLFG